MGSQGPFSFAGWTYDSSTPSNPAGYPQAIANQASSTQVINITAPASILLCGIAASGTNAATIATIQGTTLSATTVSKSGVALPAYTANANATFDAMWQPLRSISIIATGAPSTFTTEIWELSYVILGPT